VGRSITKQRVDDLDGSGAARTIAFTIDGERFEIDLSEGNAKALRAIFAPYIKAGRSVGMAARKGAKTSGGASSDAGAIQGRPRAGATPRTSTAPRHARPPVKDDSSAPTEEDGRTAEHPSAGGSVDAPLADVVPLKPRRRASSSKVDVAGQRRRFTADVAELFRVSVVAALAMTADRLVASVAKPAASSEETNRGRSGVGGDEIEDTASARTRAPISSSVVPAG